MLLIVLFNPLNAWYLSCFLDESAISLPGHSDRVNFVALYVVFWSSGGVFFVLLHMLRFIVVIMLYLCLPALQFMSCFYNVLLYEFKWGFLYLFDNCYD